MVDFWLILVNEARFRKWVVSSIKKVGGHASSVESHATSPGIPDVDFCIDGISGHIELKVCSSRGLRQSQVLWFRQRLKAGGKPWILIYCAESIYLIEGKHYQHVIQMNKEEKSKWEKIALKIWPSLPTPQDLAIGLRTNQL